MPLFKKRNTNSILYFIELKIYFMQNHTNANFIIFQEDIVKSYKQS